ncbi:DNA-binding PadR family transcriptional regulator [Bradyrhizobium sp. F1.13.1]
MALGDAILACLTERPMTGYELAKTFDSSIGFFWKADHQQIYRELSKLRDRGYIQGREVVQTGKPNKLIYTLTPEGRTALRHWAARPSTPPSIKDDLLVRLHALDSIGLEPMRTDLMARLEHHRDRHENYERILKKRFPEGAASGVLDLGNLLLLQLGARHEQMVADFCEEALEALSAMSASGTVVGRLRTASARARAEAARSRTQTEPSPRPTWISSSRTSCDASCRSTNSR